MKTGFRQTKLPNLKVMRLAQGLILRKVNTCGCGPRLKLTSDNHLSEDFQKYANYVCTQ